jgi:hypothetical protein
MRTALWFLTLFSLLVLSIACMDLAHAHGYGHGPWASRAMHEAGGGPVATPFGHLAYLLDDLTGATARAVGPILFDVLVYGLALPCLCLTLVARALRHLPLSAPAVALGALPLAMLAVTWLVTVGVQGLFWCSVDALVLAANLSGLWYYDLIGVVFIGVPVAVITTSALVAAHKIAPYANFFLRPDPH